MELNVKPDVLDALKASLRNRKKSAVRIELGGFG
jgi:hypothetical protein